MQDGMNLCDVVDGVVTQCVLLQDSVAVFGAFSGDFFTGFKVAVLPFLLGITIGAVIKLIGFSKNV